MEIQRYNDAVGLLRNHSFRNARTDQQFSSWETQEGRTFPALRQFHSSWLMYSDRTEHSEARQEVMGALREAQLPDVHCISERIAEILKEGVLTDLELRQEAQRWHRTFLGISETQQNQVLGLSESILAFFFYDRLPPGGLNELNVSRERLGAWFRSQEYGPGSLVSALLRHGAADGLVLNVIVDSLEPLYSALTSLCYLIPDIEALPSDSQAVVHEVLRLYPPFRFINRIARDGTKVSIDLYAVNRDAGHFADPEKFCLRKGARPLSFGSGIHTCPGERAATAVLSAVCQELLELKRTGLIIRVSGSPNLNAGFCKFDNLKISYCSGAPQNANS